MGSTTVQIRRIKDAYVDQLLDTGIVNGQPYTYSNNAIINYGRANKLMIGNVTCSEKLCYINIDKSSIPQGAIITSCILKATLLSSPQYNVTLSLHKITDSWDEYSVTYNTRPKTEVINSNFITINANTTVNTAINLDITPYLSQLDYGFALYAISSTATFLELNSNENANQLYAEITYTTDVPQKPTLIYPLAGEVLNKNIASTYRFTWDSTGHSGFDLQHSQDGINWTTISQTTTNKYCDVNISSLSVGNLFWRLRIKDNNGIYSQYTDNVKIQIGVRPTTPTISLIGASTSNPQITWGKDNTQTSYQVQIYKGAALVEDSGIVETVGNSYNLKNRLDNNTTYTIKLKIKNILDIWSLEATQNITTGYTNPASPTVLLTKDLIKCYMNIAITNTNGTEATLYNEIYRSEDNVNFSRIAKNIAINSTYNDYSIESGKTYYYKVRALGNNGFADSIVISNSLEMSSSQLVRLDIKDFVNFKYNLDSQSNQSFDVQFLQFAGRKKQVAEYSELDANNIMNLKFTVNKKADYIKLLSVVNAKQILLYRDTRGRKIYCSTVSCDIKDNVIDREYFDIALCLREIDYSEVV